MKPAPADPGDTTLERLLNWLPTILTALVLVGAMMLMQTAIVPGGPPLSAIDALFTATAAVTCTGLSVRDPAVGFSGAGQTALIILTLAGALFYMVGGAAIAFRLRDRLDPDRAHATPSLPRLAAGVAITALAIELIAALLMMPLWNVPDFLTGSERFGQRLGWSFFHALSAFCNSGWTLDRGNLQDYRHAMLSHGLIAPLVVLGGLGYPVLRELGCWAGAWIKRIIHGAFSRDGMPSLSRYSKLAIGVTAGLYLVGVVAIMAGQLKPNLDPWLNRQTENRQPPPELTKHRLAGMLADASFTSISARSSAFHVMPLDDSGGGSDWLRPAGRFVLMPLMLIGGTPGGAAGGMTTVALGLILAAVAAALAGRSQTTLFGRPVDTSLVRFALAMLVCWLGLVCLVMFLLSLSEPFPASSLLFTAISSAGNAGQSLDSINMASLTPFGKATVAAAMLLGRVGGLVVMGEMMLSVPDRSAP